MTTEITVQATIAAPLADVWRAWTTPADITRWYAASDDWHITRSEVDLRGGGGGAVGGKRRPRRGMWHVRPVGA